VKVGARWRIALTDVVLMSASLGLSAQVDSWLVQMPQTSKAQGASDQSGREPDSQAEQELQKGTALTRVGAFAEAIPHLIAARGRASNDYAASFNLSLCYVATGQPTLAIPILTDLRAAGHDNADVNNLLAQACVGDGQNQKALEALQKASRLEPENEKLYLFVADACMAKQEYAVGLQVVDLGLHHLPGSAHLHYQRGMFLASLDELDAGKKDFDQAIKLAHESDIAFVAAAQKAMFEGNVSEAVRAAREGVKKGHHDYILLTLLGEALLRSGIAPGQAEFAEAREALELGFHISFAGIVTFPKSTGIQEAARMVPADRLLIETDAPFLAPVPMRGKRNEPAFVVQTARKVAELRGITPDEIAAITVANFERLFLNAERR